ncbi:MAG: AAA family ATPase, partial [Casimicrobiaceae bacterium]
MICPSCETPGAAGARFCAHCGTALVPRCPSCGAEHAPDARFCAQCGIPLAAAVVAPAVPRRTPIPADSPASGAITSTIERRHMTFMFCDLVGSTELSQALDPEDLRDVVGAYRDAAGTAVGHFEGTTAQYYGDGILVYFGFPIAHEDDGRRAVQAALQILESVAGLNARLRTTQPVSLSVRIGIHTGLAVVGDVGGANRTERLAMGDAPNIAARVQGVARPNTVVISAATHKLVSEFFRTETLGAQAFKGVGDPVEVFTVLGPSGAHDRTDRPGTARLTAYVGRESVLTALNVAWADASAGRGRFVVVTGDAGVGKSRLLRVFREGLASVPHHIIECFSSPYHANSALYPITEMLRARLRLNEENDPRIRLERVRAHLMENRADTEGGLPLVAQLLGIPPDAGYSPLALHPLTQKQRTLEVLLTLLLAPAERRPTLLLIEDAHWVDPTTLELLSALLERLTGTKLLVLLSARPTFRQP